MRFFDFRFGHRPILEQLVQKARLVVVPRLAHALFVAKAVDGRELRDDQLGKQSAESTESLAACGEGLARRRRRLRASASFFSFRASGTPRTPPAARRARGTARPARGSSTSSSTSPASRRLPRSWTRRRQATLTKRVERLFVLLLLAKHSPRLDLSLLGDRQRSLGLHRLIGPHRAGANARSSPSQYAATPFSEVTSRFLRRARIVVDALEARAARGDHREPSAAAREVRLASRGARRRTGTRGSCPGAWTGACLCPRERRGCRGSSSESSPSRAPGRLRRQTRRRLRRRRAQWRAHPNRRSANAAARAAGRAPVEVPPANVNHKASSRTNGRTRRLERARTPVPRKTRAARRARARRRTASMRCAGQRRDVARVARRAPRRSPSERFGGLAVTTDAAAPRTSRGRVLSLPSFSR